MRIVLLGAPGSGKGTQAKRLAAYFRVPQISTGDILRTAADADTDFGRHIAALLKAGQLVSDDVVIDAVTAALRAPASRRGFILDGFPRNIPQAQEIDTRLSWMGRPLQLALNFAIDPERLIRRVTGRISCNGCGAIYNRYFMAPVKRGVCDHCGAKQLVKRSDDQARTFAKRLEAYHLESEPLIDYFRAQQKLRTIHVDEGASRVFELIGEVIHAEIRPFDKKVAASEVSTQVAPIAERVISGGAVERAATTVRKSAKKKKVTAKRSVKKKTPQRTSPKEKVTAKRSLKKKTPQRAAAKKKVTARLERKKAAGKKGLAAPKTSNKSAQRVSKKAARKTDKKTSARPKGKRR
ncbi:MAG: nucleoside monophosphate kinase [Pseudomonadota bacterium]|nr:nucleoside monophosphate kinase [Pseudomonadota bacterium]